MMDATRTLAQTGGSVLVSGDRSSNRPSIKLAGQPHHSRVAVAEVQAKRGALRIRRSALEQLLGDALAVVDRSADGVSVRVRDTDGTKWHSTLTGSRRSHTSGATLSDVTGSTTIAASAPGPPRRYELRGLKAWLQRHELREGARVHVRRHPNGGLLVEVPEDQGEGREGGSPGPMEDASTAAAGAPSEEPSTSDAGRASDPLGPPQQPSPSSLHQAQPGAVARAGGGGAPGQAVPAAEPDAQREQKRQRTSAPSAGHLAQPKGTGQEQRPLPGLVASAGMAGLDGSRRDTAHARQRGLGPEAGAAGACRDRAGGGPVDGRREQAGAGSPVGSAQSGKHVGVSPSLVALRPHRQAEPFLQLVCSVWQHVTYVVTYHANRECLLSQVMCRLRGKCRRRRWGAIGPAAGRRGGACRHTAPVWQWVAAG